MTSLSIAYLNTFTFSCVQMILYTTIPYITDVTGVETSNIIAAISVGSLIFAFMGPFWAARSDTLGRQRVLSFGMFGLMLSFTCLALIFLFNTQLSLLLKTTLVFISRILYGTFVSAVVPVSQAWQLDLSDKKSHVKVLTKNSMCLNLGRILGPILVLFKQLNLEYVIYSACIWSLILALFVFFSSDFSSAHNNIEKVSLKLVLKRWKKSIDESLYPILLALVFTAFIGILYSFLGHHIKTLFNFSGKDASLMFAKIILVISLASILFQQLSLLLLKEAWFSRLLIGTISIVVGTYLMMEAWNEPVLWGAIILVSLACALIPPVYLALVSKSEETEASQSIFGKKLGLSTVAHSLGYALGSGLIALSMKMKIVSSSVVVFLICMAIIIISYIIAFNKYRSDRVGEKLHA